MTKTTRCHGCTEITETNLYQVAADLGNSIPEPFTAPYCTPCADIAKQNFTLRQIESV